MAYWIKYSGHQKWLPQKIRQIINFFIHHWSNFHQILPLERDFDTIFKLFEKAARQILKVSHFLEAGVYFYKSLFQ